MKKTYYSVEDLKKIVRLEELGSELWNPADREELTFEGMYEITLEDMQAALHTIIDKKLPLIDVRAWDRCLASTFSNVLGPQDIIRFEHKEECPYYDFPADEMGALNRVWEMLFEYELEIELSLMAEFETFDQLAIVCDAAEYIECFFKNQTLAKEQWVYPKFMKRTLLNTYEYYGELEVTTDEVKARLVQYVDELAAEDDELALKIRCDGRYTGNSVYRQDFYASRDDAERLFELTEDPMYANTLGYIYYYGRVNGGKAEYEKALPYFVFGAANGVHESIYKLADMYRNGYAVQKSEKTAYSMISRLYDELLAEFEKGDDEGSFADVALRRGSMVLHGAGTVQDTWTSLHYLLAAEYAIQRRMKEYNFYGDKTVCSHIKECIAEAKKLLFPEKNTGKYMADEYWPVEHLFKDDYRIAWKAKPLKSGEWSITFKRIAKQYEDEASKAFFVVPELYYCMFTDTVKGRVTPLNGNMLRKGRADSIDVDYKQGEYFTVLYYDGKPVLKLKGRVFDWWIEKPKKPSGRKVRLVGVTFVEGGEQYHYLCDLDDVKVGDRVVVDGYEGETEVVVRDVRDVPEEELELPLKRFKTIKRKL